MNVRPFGSGATLGLKFGGSVRSRQLIVISLVAGLSVTCAADRTAPAAKHRFDDHNESDCVRTPVPSYVARTERTLRSALSSTDACSFVSLSCPLGAQISLSTLNSTGSTLAVNLRGASMRTAGQYVGEPPPEIRDLVQSTIADAEAVAEAANAANECLRTSSGSVTQCASAMGTLDRTKYTLESTLDAWQPYL